MLRPDRLTAAAMERGTSLITAGSHHAVGALRGRVRALTFVGTALALAGTGSAAAATTAGSSPTPLTAAAHAAPPITAASDAAAVVIPVAGPRAVLGHAVTTVADPPLPSQGAAARARPRTGAARRSAAARQGHRAAGRRTAPLTWKQVRDEINRATNPAAAGRGRLPLADRLMPVGTSGPQAWMPISGAQVANATTIVRQALARRMGIRSAVIAVATAMQESRLLNLDYGTGDSLGLFQQQPVDGWGSPQQVLDPAYAANAFLRALRQYQEQDRSWAMQPLWANAQAVQRSAFPFAYAKWEMQAASLVRQIAMTVR